MQVAQVNIAGEDLELHPYRAIWWKAESTLLMADLHIGKAAHFRKEGIQVPLAIIQINLQKFAALLSYYHPKQVFMLGDLFHSDANHEWGLFIDLLSEYPNIDFHLIVGNHDDLKALSLIDHNMTVHKSDLDLGPFCLSHHPKESFTEDKYHLCGHLHPGVKLKGIGKQQLKLACFHFSKHQGILPGFGELTGKYLLPIKKEDLVFVVTEEAVIPV